VTVALNKGHRRRACARDRDLAGLHEGGLYGLAIDLGSTTVAAHLTDLVTGEVKASFRHHEPADPLRRRPDEPGELCHDEPRRRRGDDPRRARGDQRWQGEIAAEAGIDPHLIVETVFVCNPVMHHLLLGIDPVELGQAPFALATSESLTLDARPSWTCRPSTRARASTCCPASRAMWGPIAPPWRCRRSRANPRISP
jgi:uncharacterized 2Fe-2S/4Fe-4S cluster protein (DUF4445 family)